MTIYILVVLSCSGTSLFFHVQFLLLLPDLHIGFSRGRSGGLVFPSLSEFLQFLVIHTVKGFGIISKAEIDVFLELSCFFHDPEDVGNLISSSSAFSKTSLNVREFTVHVLLKPGLENFEKSSLKGRKSKQSKIEIYSLPLKKNTLNIKI